MIYVLIFSRLFTIFLILNILKRRNNTKSFIVFINNLNFRIILNVLLEIITIIFDLRFFKINIINCLNH